MTVQTSNNVATFDGNGITTVHPFNFKFFDGRDLVVLLIDRATRETETLVLNSDFTVQGAGGESGGSVTTSIAPPTGKVLRVSRELKITQDTSLRNQGKFLAEVHEDVFDKQVMISQQIQEQVDRSVKVPVDGTGTGDELVEQLFDARDIAVQSAAEAEAIAEKFGDVDEAVTLAEQAAATAGTSAVSSAASAAQASASSTAAQTAADSAQTSASVYPDVAAGLAATPADGYFSVVSPDSAEYLILYRDVGGVAVEQKRYPSAQIDGLTIEKGKAYPFRQMTRAGTTSAENPYWSNSILSVCVVNARPGEYYQIAWQANESPYLGENNFNWIIRKFDAATFPTTGENEALVELGDVQPQFTRTGGIQTVVIIPKNRLEMQFVITVDPSGLPPAGTAVNSNSGSTFPAWSWIIDTSCYSYASEYKSPQVDTLSVNSRKVFPLNAVLPRAGVISADYQPFRDLFLDIEIFGAEAGKLYRVSYIASTAVVPVDASKASLGFRIEEFDKATYEASGVASNIQNFPTIVGVVSRTGGPQTLTFETTAKPTVVVKITLDGAKIPADGSAFASVNAGFPGRNWIIDESRYKRTATSGATGEAQKNGVYYTYNQTTKVLTYAYVSGDYAYRVTVRPVAMNGLPNLTRIDRAPKVADLSLAAWALLSDTETDYLPPMIVEAVSGGDSAPRYYTGGAHGSDGNAGGVPTARNTLYTVYIDGQLLDKTASGYAGSVQCMIINELFAYNTISLNRYVLQQAFSLDMSGAGMEIYANITALEPVNVSVDNGPQAYFGGFNTTQMLADSEFPARTALDPSVLSGARTAYPKAWLLLMKSSNGTMACWVDRSYEAGDGRYVSPDASFIRGGGVGRAKFYNAIVAAASANLAAGESYKWRGGYHFFSDTAQAGFDTKAALTIGRSKKLVTVAIGGVSLTV
ncbi:hypothetical protein [Pseudomonas sp. FP2294]|uniref:hypothetical protein n=1 Tax=Pseudomonas sp. FP2294 TaxID=2954089 RepID=UPI0027349B72|nr:hypothetical protein [Pseudomonas sp. FP2294]WLH55580.1 hypothetical protein PSH73_16805 [Pseudomonas sp. FP2294]